MNMLNSLFNVDDIEIKIINKKYMILFICFLVLIVILLFLKKTNYYINTFTMTDDKIILLVEKDMINVIKDNSKIIIDNIDCNYSINTITLVDNLYMIDINTNIVIKNMTSGIYKVYLGKERLFEYIIRVIKS